MTTVGYGDKAPRTFGGRVVAAFWMFVSIVRTLVEGAGAGRTGRTPGVARPSACNVIGPAMPSAASRLARWYRCSARWVAASKNP